MDLYISSLVLGAVGLGAMALSGLGHGHGGNAARGSGHGHAGGGSHAGNAHAGHGHAGHGGHGGHTAGQPAGARDAAANVVLAAASPRVLFSLALGFGATGELLRSVLGGPFLLAAAVVGGVAFERLIVSPLWNLMMRFASTPAAMLESAVADEATAVTSFDANGQGIVSIEVDGQIVQILATLRRDDRTLGGARIRSGQKVRIDEIDAKRNCCTVSLL